MLYNDNASQPFNGSFKGSNVVFVDFDLEGANNYFDVLHESILKDIYYDGVTFTDNWPAEDSYLMDQNETFPFISEVSMYTYM